LSQVEVVETTNEVLCCVECGDELLVRLYHDMGLNPRQIAERARESAPRLAITESLAVRILSAPRR
jgi:hypothetical protein